ncbi:Gfo/Idh/MocA family oxidoreductase [Fulvimarina sp. 2208YS6-2-32]|uniref:Gfo/Idh/MocA family oxidoreductase n=1 Tax=Fulvimarina uroteuthidis TaxID=3098149 RepID=A0ABU5HZ45_9HYPH|nr:Gfo/Idh/MocA family oxidoreductase [Fulvimarina sp. 2208YS6-2-32]MDY8108033.1 Gfo/Idh/MocA family oxidoreductase [Fulvimarina sp. 2208YS6-2-32]
MKIAIVGCGYVADYYMLTLANHPDLELIGAYDRDPAAAQRFTAHFKVPMFESFEALLEAPGLELVLNLTTPESHYEISRAALEAGHHVYSEKPLAMTLADAEALVALSREKALMLAAAPCSHLGEAARSLDAEIRSGAIGEPRLVYAEMEDAMVFRDRYHLWRSPSGAPWPAAHEFEIGATLEHAGYYLTWLCAFFGPVRQLTAFAALTFPDKGTGQAPETLANDFSVAVMTFENGVTARLTCGLAAPKDRSFHVVGTNGMLSVSDGWDYRSPIYRRDVLGHWNSTPAILGKVLKRLQAKLPARHWFGARVKTERSGGKLPATNSKMDFSRGPAAIAAAAKAGKPLEFGADFALHVTELALMIQNADRTPMPYRPKSSFARAR